MEATMAWRCRAYDVPVVESDQHEDVPVIPEPEEDDMEVDIEEDENQPELTYPYEEMAPLNPPLPASESEHKDAIEVKNPTEHDDETVLASIHKVGESSTALFLCEDSDGLLPGLMRRDISFLFGWMASLLRRLCGRKTTHALVEKKGKAKDEFYGKLILYLGNEVRSSVEQGTTAIKKLVEKLGNAEDKVECKKLKNKLEEARIMPLKSAPLTQAIVRRMIKDNVDASIAAERARQANVRNKANGSRPARGQDVTLAVYKFAAATLQRPALTWWNSKIAAMGLETMNRMPWTEMKQLLTAKFCPIEERFNELALMCLRMVEPKSVKVDAYIQGLTDNIKGEVTSSMPANLSKVLRMAHKLMDQKAQARDERILEGKKRKWENIQGVNSSGKGNQKDNSRQTLQNNQRQGNARAMVTAPTDGKVSSGSLPLYERCFTHHVGQCTIKCHKCGKVGHKSRYCKEKNVATGANALPISTCYDCGEQGHTRNRCPKKVKQEEVKEVRGRAYAIKDVEPKGPNVVTGTFLLNNRYAFDLFDSGFDRSFVDTRFSSMLDIDPVKIGASYEVELADGRVVSTNTVLKGCTLNLVNHVFEIDLMPIELSTFDVIIGMDWLVKHDAVIVCGERFVRIPYGNKMLIVERDKGVSRLKVISCIKAQDVPMIRDFLEVFPEVLPGLPPPRQVEFQIDLVSGAAPVARAPYRLAPSKMKELSDKKKYENHLKIILELLKKERFGVHVDPAKVKVIKSWAAPMTPIEVRLWSRIDAKRKKELNLRQQRWIKLLSDYDREIWYHPGKANVMVDVLSRKERDKPLRVRALMMTIHNDLPKQIRESQEKVMKGKNVKAENLGRLIKPIFEFCLMEHVRSLQKALGTNLDTSTAYHPQMDGQSERTIQTLEDMLRACVIEFRSSWDHHLPLVEFSYNNSYHASIKAAPYEALYGRKCRSPVYWSEVGDSQLTGPELIRDTTEKIVQIKNRLLAARSLQKSYADKRAKPLDFEVGDMVLLKKCLAEGDVVIPLDEIQLDDKLHMIKEPVEVVDRTVKRLRLIRIPIVKVR
nr:hypothetical protein [Tanacetum cinerariifolium]